MKALFIRLLGKLVVKLHYKRELNVYELCQEHEPELWAKANKKAKISSSVRWEVWRRDAFTCVYCGAFAHNLTLDHLIPEKYGGEAVVENLVSACSSCNQRKGSEPFEKFIKSKWLKKKRQLMLHQRSLTTKEIVQKLSNGIVYTLNDSGERCLLEKEE